VVGSFPFLGAAMGLTVSLLGGGRRRFVHHI
jgi:hypothetical protein